MNKENNIKCKHLLCDDWPFHESLEYCQYHQRGGVLGDGSAFEQYEIIEADFIDFIKILPINEPNHMEVYSPFLRDIIIRSCVQVELFFKEWSLLECSEKSEIELNTKFHKKDKNGNNKGVKSWNFNDYYHFKDNLQNEDYIKIYVNPLNENINPFENWTKKSPPFWWNSYNEIKHGGAKSIKVSTLKNALYSLAALFLMHCINTKSRNFLSKFQNVSFSVQGKGDLKMEFHGLTSPIDSKRYLFRYNHFNTKQKIELVTIEKLKKTLKSGTVGQTIKRS